MLTALSVLFILAVGFGLGHLHGRWTERKAIIGTNRKLVFDERLRGKPWTKLQRGSLSVVARRWRNQRASIHTQKP